MKTVFITGATSGIGAATARILAPNYRLILCGRRIKKLSEIETELKEITEVITLSFDVRDKKEVFDCISNLPENWKNVNILVNNAGNAYGLERFQDADLDDLDAMIDINVKGLIYVTKALLPFLLEQKEAHIINLSSIAGKETYQNGTVYCASKAAVEAISKGLRLDLVSEGVKVTNIAPGAVETEFSKVRFKGDDKKAASVYKGFEPLTANDVANTIKFAIEQPENIQLADITIFPKAQAGITSIFRK